MDEERCKSHIDHKTEEIWENDAFSTVETFLIQSMRSTRNILKNFAFGKIKESGNVREDSGYFGQFWKLQGYEL